MPSEKYPVIRSARSNFDVLLVEPAGARRPRERSGGAREPAVERREHRGGRRARLRNIDKASAQLPDTLREVNALVVELRGTAADIRTVAQNVQPHDRNRGPRVHGRHAARATKSPTTSSSASAQLDKLVEGQPHAICARFTREGLPEFERFLREGRSAAREIRELSRTACAKIPRSSSTSRRREAWRFRDENARAIALRWPAWLPLQCWQAAAAGSVHRATRPADSDATSCAPRLRRERRAAEPRKGPSLRIGRDDCPRRASDPDRILLVRDGPPHGLLRRRAAGPRRFRTWSKTWRWRRCAPAGSWAAVHDSQGAFSADYLLQIASAVSRRTTPTASSPKVHVVLDCTLGRRIGSRAARELRRGRRSVAAGANRMGAVVAAFEIARRKRALATMAERRAGSALKTSTAPSTP